MHFCGYHWVWQTDLLYDVLSILFNNKLGKFILLCLDSTSTFYCWSPFIMPKRICMHGSFNLPHTNKVCAQLLLRRILRTCANLVPLRTGTCYIRDNFVLFLQGYCTAGITNEMNSTSAVAPPHTYRMSSLLVTPTQCIRKYGFVSEPVR